MNNASNNAQRSTLRSLQSVSTLLIKILLQNDRDSNGGVSVESRSFYFTISSFIRHVKRWARRRVALVWPRSALTVPLISPILVCALMHAFFKSLLAWYWHPSPCRNSIFVANVDLPRSAAIFNVDCRGNLRYFFLPTFLLTCLF